MTWRNTAYGIQPHKDKDVNQALIRLLDALCSWERGTGRQSILILREDDYCCRADSGKCIVPPDITDEELLKHFSTTKGGK